jgi:uncharacterized membrane protein
MSSREMDAGPARASELPMSHQVETPAQWRGHETRRDTLNTLRVAVLIASTITMGLTAGVFTLYAHTIMPGLGRTDDRTFVGAFQSMDKAIINPWFMAGGFFGALVFTALAVALHLGEDRRSILPWVGAALALYFVAFVITIGVNVPLNDALKAAGSPDRIADLASVRDRFNEAKWTSWHLVRTITTVGAFGCLTWALVLFGRATR